MLNKLSWKKVRNIYLKVKNETDLIIELLKVNLYFQNLNESTKDYPRRSKNKDYLLFYKRRQISRCIIYLIQAINHLNYELQFCPRSRSMSLLAYCYFMSQDFLNSARVYEQLTKYYPDVT